jgi:hypothetical protein
LCVSAADFTQQIFPGLDTQLGVFVASFFVRIKRNKSKMSRSGSNLLTVVRIFAMNANNFGKEVKRTFTNVLRLQTRQHGKRIRVFNGLSVIDGSEVATGAFAVSVTSGTSNF